MSFQHFRLGEITPVHHHLQQATPVSTSKQPYGAGDSEDGYTLVFANLDEFQAWRLAEEERNCVEFVKGDTHGSKADPPRFKEHTKLVCARHSRSGRKKYVKKHPERIRKVPSRKLEGTGCQASISFKTYFDSEQVRACYIQLHSHPVGSDNLPFTRRGRKAAALAERDRGRNKTYVPDQNQVVPAASSSNVPSQPQPAPAASAPAPAQPLTNPLSSALSVLAPLPGQPFAPPPQAQTFTYPPGVEYGMQTPNQDRWDNMGTLFQTVREHARTYSYPAASVAALETVLIRLYLESPIGSMAQQGIVNAGIAADRSQPQSVPIQDSPGGMNANANGEPSAGGTS